MQALVGKPQQVGTYRAELGESPVWDAARQRLLWLDILQSRLLLTNPGSGETVITDLAGRPGAIALAAGGNLVAATGRDIVALGPEGRAERLQTLPAEASLRLNDGKPDAAGRFWVGTASADGAPVGALYRIESGRAPATVVLGVRMSNGIGWSPDNRTLYYVDTGTRSLDAFDFDLTDGTPTNRRTLLELPPGQLPDGLTVDAGGRIWLAIWGGSCVLVVTPAGEIAARLDLPTSRVASCTFGGPSLRTLFVTTAQEGATAEELAADRFAGALFAVETEAQGLLPNRVSLATP
ncbi:MAG: SMP-30/gluconolactonase/LRE family protein [Devosia sp.]|nr:SMP-30/gluconolactonase/LRE family protein [Devosia sp.]